MVTLELVKECLDVMDVVYDDFDENTLLVNFSKSDEFPYEVRIVVRLSQEGHLLQFTSIAQDFHPEGNLLELSNQHNLRNHAPICHINLENGDIVMEQAFHFTDETSPHFLLDNVLRPGIFLPLHTFAIFLLSDEEVEARNNE